MFPQVLTSRLLSLCVLLGLALGTTGCSSWMGGQLKEPELRLLDVEVIRARLMEQEFMLRFRIDNPNDRSLPIRGFDYSVYLNQMKLADGDSTTWLSVPANGHAEFEIPVRANLWRHMKSIVRLLEKPDQPISYELQARLKTGLMFGQTLHLQRNGTLLPLDLIPE